MDEKNSEKDISEILLKNILFTLLIGTGCLLVGIVYYIYAKDKVFLVLSSLVFAFALLHSIELYRVMENQQYKTIEGTCTGLSTRFFQKYVGIHILRQDGVETLVHIRKGSNIKVGMRYRFYLNMKKPCSVNNKYLNTALSENHVLSFEELTEWPGQETSEK